MAASAGKHFESGNVACSAGNAGPRWEKEGIWLVYSTQSQSSGGSGRRSNGISASILQRILSRTWLWTVDTGKTGAAY